MEFLEMLRILQNPPEKRSGKEYRLYEAAWSCFMKDFRSVIEATVVRYCGRNKFGSDRQHRHFIDDCIAEVLVILVKNDNRAIRNFRGQTPGQLRAYLWRITKYVVFKYVPREPREEILEPRIYPQSTLRDIYNEISVRIQSMQDAAEKKGRKAKNRYRDIIIYFLSDQLSELGLGGFTDEEIRCIPFLQSPSENTVRLAKFRIRRLLQLSGGQDGL